MIAHLICQKQTETGVASIITLMDLTAPVLLVTVLPTATTRPDRIGAETAASDTTRDEAAWGLDQAGHLRDHRRCSASSGSAVTIESLFWRPTETEMRNGPAPH